MKKIAVLSGGGSREREISLRSGRNVLSSLIRKGYEAISIDPSSELVSKLEAFAPDLVFIALHGKNGEDGNIQGLLNFHNYRYTGSGVLASALCMDKTACKRMLVQSDIPTPGWLFLGAEPNEEIMAEALSMTFPLVVKPVGEGSSIGVEIIKKKDHFQNRVKALQEKYGDYFAEQFIQGTEITASVTGNKQSAMVFPLLELVPKKEFYDYEAKYTAGMTEFIIPARISARAEQKARDYTQRIFREFKLNSLARIDMLVKDNEVWVIDINTIPGMTDTSDLPAQAAAAGISFDDLIDSVVRDCDCPG